jgi:hypothetical protein
MSRGREDWVMQHMGFSNWDLGVVILNSTLFSIPIINFPSRSKQTLVDMAWAPFWFNIRRGENG